MNDEEGYGILFKVAVAIVLLLTVIMFAVAFCMIFTDMEGWVVACYAIAYCIAVGFISNTFILPKVAEAASEEKAEEVEASTNAEEEKEGE